MTEANRETREWQPKGLQEFRGQRRLIDILSHEVRAALQEHRPLPNALFSGPPGLGKTTLIHVLGEVMGVKPKILMGSRVTDLTLSEVLGYLPRERSTPSSGSTSARR
jgi:Holliday junction resolvasome RuvABC ATP-dependent DNA helicase subunit